MLSGLPASQEDTGQEHLAVAWSCAADSCFFPWSNLLTGICAYALMGLCLASLGQQAE